MILSNIFCTVPQLFTTLCSYIRSLKDARVKDVWSVLAQAFWGPYVEIDLYWKWVQMSGGGSSPGKF